MRYRPIGSDPLDGRLGRYIPDDWRHLENYPITALLEVDRPSAVPVVIGVNWYAAFDEPERDERSGEMFIGHKGDLGRIRGGHCVCLEPGGDPDTDDWYRFYDQGHEGACVGFGWSRCMTLLNKGLYAARWLWDRAKEHDEWPQTNPGDDEGTSVRAAAEVLVSAGHVDWDPAFSDDDSSERAGYRPDVADGILAFRWATSAADVHQVLANPRADELNAVPILNSWGESYPHRVWMPDEVLDRLIGEDGEVAIPTDR
ncbi:hypothetical protein GCM10017786_17750 [Amycolatopsis deserti]|uniref:Uncharacterized protein n=1 Tax=Amycolatopsis deserti TaxID=185696 RepID=A0ABQ3IKN2_9PSEU|nr:hypothetical protein [Amycolatopsis deserti]GHE86705.1 hypothetical protein GCM10017786_17750 [Amycolatopsis deserti]